jgi:hypothetical protein
MSYQTRQILHNDYATYKKEKPYLTYTDFLRSVVSAMVENMQEDTIKLKYKDEVEMLESVIITMYETFSK